MANKLKPFFITIIVFLFIFLVGKYVLDTLFGDMCSNKIVQKLPSPNGDKMAYAFTRDCGATTGFSPQLSILDKDDKIQNKTGNTFRSNKDFTIEWLDEKQLVVNYNKSSETYEMDKKVNGIKVVYVKK